MSKPQFHIGIKNNVTADMNDGVCEIHFLDTIANKEYFDWDSMSYQTESLLQAVMDEVNSIKPKKIIQSIDSWGGDADLGKGIYNFLKNYPAKVETKIINKAASAATAMACAGSKITMPATGFYVIHECSNFAIGTAKDLREAAAVADKYTDAYCEIYATNNRKGKTAEEIKALISGGDYWMTGREAVEMGFVDSCYDDATVSVTACIGAAKEIYTNIPQRILDLGVTAEVEPESKTLIQQFMDLKSLVTAALGAIGKGKVDPKSENITADIAEALAQPLNDMMDAVQLQVTANVGEQTAALSEGITASVTTALETKYSETIAALEAKITNLTADLEKLAGKESGAADRERGEDKPKMKVRMQ